MTGLQGSDSKGIKGAARTTGQPQAKQKTAVLLRLSYSLFLKQSVDGDTRTAFSHLYVRIDIEDFRDSFMSHDLHRWSRAFDDAILKDEKVCRIADSLIDFMQDHDDGQILFMVQL